MIASARVIHGSGRYHTEQIAYYTGDEREPEDDKGELKGRFLGSLAKERGLIDSEIEHLDQRVKLLASGRDLDGTVLRKGSGTTREVIDPKTGEVKLLKSTTGIDIVLSADKSVSLAWALSDQSLRSQIEEAHKKAVEAAFTKIESNAYRRKASGLEKAQIIAGEFQHSTSREGDAQLHSHLMVFNVAKSENGSGALDVKRLLKDLHTYGAIYQNELAKGLHELGFETERIKLEKGEAVRISNAGFSQDLLDHFSKRSAQIDEFVKEHGTDRQTACLKTRVQKEELVDRHKLFSDSKERASQFGYDINRLNQFGKEKDHERINTQQKEQKLEEQVLHSINQKENFTAIKRSDVEKTYVRLSSGAFSYSEIKDLSKRFTEKHLHEIASASDKWKRDQKPTHLKFRTGRSEVLKVIAHKVKSKTSKEYSQRLSEIYRRKEELKEKREQKQIGTPLEKERIYTLKTESKRRIEKDSLYSKIRSKLIKPLQRVLPEGKPLSYQYRKKQYEKSCRKFEKRQKAFQRKIFFAYVTGKISHRQYKQYRDGKPHTQSKLVANAKWIFGSISKAERNYIIRKLDKQSEKEQKRTTRTIIQLSGESQKVMRREPPKYREVVFKAEEKKEQSPKKETPQKVQPQPEKKKAQARLVQPEMEKRQAMEQKNIAAQGKPNQQQQQPKQQTPQPEKKRDQGRGR